MGARRDDLLDTTMVRMPDGSYLPQSQVRGMSASQIADLYKSMGGFGSTLDSGTGIQSAQEMFNQTYAEAMANESLANILETQGVPSLVPFSVQGALQPVNVADGINRFETDYVKGLLDQGLVTVDQVAKQTGIPAEEIQQQYNTLTGLDPDTEQNIREELSDFLESQETEDFSTGLENELEGGMLDTGAGDESIVTDDPQAQWEEVDKDADFDVILEKALDIFGVYNRDAIKNVVDVVNDRGMSVGDVAIATGNTVESINQAAAESGTAIENQGLVTPDPESPQPPQDPDPESPAVDPQPPADPTVVMDTPVSPEVVMDTPITPTILPESSKKPSVTLIQNILNEAPITESILFPTQFTKLENVQQGMFGQFLSAAGGNNDIS
jgi:hypothetical protein